MTDVVHNQRFVFTSRDEFLAYSFLECEEHSANSPHADTGGEPDEYDKLLDDGQDAFYLAVPMPVTSQLPSAGVADNHIIPHSQASTDDNMLPSSQLASAGVADDHSIPHSQATTDDNMLPSSQLPSTDVEDDVDEHDMSDLDGLNNLPPIPFGDAWSQIRYNNSTGVVSRSSSSSPTSTSAKTKSSLSKAVATGGTTAVTGKDTPTKLIRISLFTEVRHRDN